MFDIEVWGERRTGDRDKRPNDKRPEEERDRSRIIHCSSFRRLQGKTQVLGITESDFHRTRLTHSMEVAQIGRGLAYQFRAIYVDQPSIMEALPAPSLIETIGFGHDLGHPPFGHNGEVALNYMMRDAGGFEGNGQSLRILSRLEMHTPNYGLDLTRRALLGILKYPASYSALRRRNLPQTTSKFSQLVAEEWKPPKCYLDSEQDVVEWLLLPLTLEDRREFMSLSESPTPSANGKTSFKALDTSIMELADDIAYGTHDFEDGVALGLITRDHWSKALEALDQRWAAKVGINRKEITNALFASNYADSNRKLAIGTIVNAMVSSTKIVSRNQFRCPLLKYAAQLDAPARNFLQALQKVTIDHIINIQSVQTLEYRGRQLVMALFEALESDWKKLLPAKYVEEATGSGNPQRHICDYVAGMTDAYAIRIYERLFVPRQGSIFERL